MLEYLRLVNSILTISAKLMSLFKEKNVLEWLNQVEQAIDEAEKARTEDEKFVAARNFVHLIRSLH